MKAVRFPSSIDSNMSGEKTVDDIYKRSLEKRPSLDETSQQLIQSCWEAVLDEQVDQWASGHFDPERMANVCRRHSASCQVKAIVDGLRIQEEAASCTGEFYIIH